MYIKQYARLRCPKKYQNMIPTERCMQNLISCGEARPSNALLIRKKLSDRCNGQ
jgi:hypothetical protein